CACARSLVRPVWAQTGGIQHLEAHIWAQTGGIGIHCSVPTTLLISARSVAAARSGFLSKSTLRLAAIRHEAGSPFHAALTDAATSPPWAPTPGTRNGRLEPRLTSAMADGAVAPTTRPTLPCWLSRSASSATCTNSGLDRKSG